MSEKLSINVKSIGLNVTHNFIVPSDMKIDKLVSLIIKTIHEEYPKSNFTKEKKYLLMLAHSGEIIDCKHNLYQLGFSNGENFIII